MEWLQVVYWHNRVLDYLVCAGLLLLAWLLGWLAVRLLRRAAARQAQGGLWRLLDRLGARPLGWLAGLAVAHAAVRSLTLPEWHLKVVGTVFLCAWTVLGAVLGARLLNAALAAWLERVGREQDDLLVQMLKLLRSAVGAVVFAVAGLFLVANLGFDIASLLAGLGLGGLALAMASKDTLANLFGSFTILVNGPFRVGEAVNYQGQEGTVEDIGLRETRIRTWNGHLVSVPNSLAPTSVIENISRRPSFRVLFALRLPLDLSVARIDRAAELVRQAVGEQQGVDEKVLVHFIDYADDALKLQVIYYITDTANLLDIRHAVNRRIKELFDREGIPLAMPRIRIDGSPGR